MNSSSGLLATFKSQSDFINALKTLKQKGFKKLDTATSQEIEGLEKILGKSSRSGIYSLAGFLGAMTGLFGGFFMQWYSSVEQTPLNIGGRPLNSWPSFIPITYILMILGTGLALLLTFILDLRLPWPAHSVFNTSLDLSSDNFSIIIYSHDPLFESSQTSALLRQLKAQEVETLHDL